MRQRAFRLAADPEHARLCAGRVGAQRSRRRLGRASHRRLWRRLRVRQPAGIDGAKLRPESVQRTPQSGSTAPAMSPGTETAASSRSPAARTGRSRCAGSGSSRGRSRRSFGRTRSTNRFAQTRSPRCRGPSRSPRKMSGRFETPLLALSLPSRLMRDYRAIVSVLPGTMGPRACLDGAVCRWAALDVQGMYHVGSGDCTGAGRFSSSSERWTTDDGGRRRTRRCANCGWGPV